VEAPLAIKEKRKRTQEKGVNVVIKYFEPKRLPPHIAIIGRQGVGKTTLAVEAEASIICTEKGANGIKGAKIVCTQDGGDVFKDTKEIIDVIWDMASDKTVKNVAIDTMTRYVQIAAEETCKERYGGIWHAEKGKNAFLPFDSGWKTVAQEKIAPLLNALDACKDAGKGVILLFHQGARNVDDPEKGSYQIITGDVNKNIWGMIYAWCDISALADYDYDVKKKSGEKGKAEGTTSRILRSVGSVAADIKCRGGYEIPEQMPFIKGRAWADIMNALNNTSKIVDELKARIEKLNKEDRKKAMDYLGGSIENAERHHQDALLNSLKRKDNK
jgi:hypothetical protein